MVYMKLSMKGGATDMMREYIMFPMTECKYVSMKFSNVSEERMFLDEYLAEDSVAYCICCGGLIGAWAMIKGGLEYISYM